MVEMQAVESSSVSHVGYEPLARVLHVTFAGNGRTYRYSGVSQAKYDALMASESKGQYINRAIKPHHSVSS